VRSWLISIGVSSIVLACGESNRNEPATAPIEAGAIADSSVSDAGVDGADASAPPATQPVTFSSTGELRPPDWKSLPYDVEVVAVTFDYDFLKGGQVDYAVAIYRDPAAGTAYPAITGGYADMFTTHPLQFATDGHWHQRVDFSKTPLYLPANTLVTCWSSGGSDPTTLGPRSCTLDVRPAGAVRHRILRIPFLDSMQKPTEAFATSHYAARSWHPLRVKGFLMYDGVIGTYTGCLQHLGGVDGHVIEEHCLPATTRTTTADFRSYDVEPLDWTISEPNLLSARCSLTTSDLYDCAFYAIVEIPAAIPPGPDNIFRDYGNVIPAYIDPWCDHYIDAVAIPAQSKQLCDAYNTSHGRPASTPCSRADLVAECHAAFPPASTCAPDGGGC
jgi:hypothetical protein